MRGGRGRDAFVIVWECCRAGRGDFGPVSDRCCKESEKIARAWTQRSFFIVERTVGPFVRAGRAALSGAACMHACPICRRQLTICSYCTFVAFDVWPPSVTITLSPHTVLAFTAMTIPTRRSICMTNPPKSERLVCFTENSLEISKKQGVGQRFMKRPQVWRLLNYSRNDRKEEYWRILFIFLPDFFVHPPGDG